MQSYRRKLINTIEIFAAEIKYYYQTEKLQGNDLNPVEFLLYLLAALHEDIKHFHVKQEDPNIELRRTKKVTKAQQEKIKKLDFVLA